MSHLAFLNFNIQDDTCNVSSAFTIKSTGNKFTIKNALEMISFLKALVYDFIIKMHRKQFFYKNVWQMILLSKCMVKDFAIKTHGK